MEEAVKKDFKLIVDNEGLESLSPADKAGAKEELQRWPLFGLSVGSFLQVINMEQQTCLLEVYRGANQLGHFCIVEGALYNAICGDREAEDAAMEMISWENVRLNIKQILNTSSIERKIEKNLMLLLMESSRRRDEAEDNNYTQEIIEEEELLVRDMEKATLDACFKILTKDMGDALISGSIISIRSSKVLASYNIKPEAAALFKRLTDYFRNVFAGGLLGGGLGDHYILDLKGKQTLVVLILGDYQWAIVFNNVKCTLGLFRNIIMPKVVKTFNEMNL
jgi:Domain of unknown function (DUF4388)